MNTQQAFELMFAGLKKQGCPSIEFNEGIKKYRHRTEDGRRSLLGFLISDGEYSEDLDGKTVRYIRERVPSLCSLNLEFLSRADTMYLLHLTSIPPEKFQEKLERVCRRLAKDFKLQYPF